MKRIRGEQRRKERKREKEKVERMESSARH